MRVYIFFFVTICNAFLSSWTLLAYWKSDQIAKYFKQTYKYLGRNSLNSFIWNKDLVILGKITP